MARHPYRNWAATAAAALVAGTLLAGPSAAYAQDDWGEDSWRDDQPFVRVHPREVPAGEQVTIRGRCPISTKTAEIQSRAFSRRDVIPVHLTPDFTFVEHVHIPVDIRPGQYPVALKCDSKTVATTNLEVLGMERPIKGPRTGGGGTAASEGIQDSGSGAAIPLAVIGGGLAVATSGAAILLVRRRRSS